MARVRHSGGLDFRGLKKHLKKLPATVAVAAAPKVAGELTTRARAAFDGGSTVYGDARPSSVNGGPLTLVRTGATRAAVRFASAGSVVRAVLSQKYTRYLIRYGILPNGKAAMPSEWSKATGEIVGRTLQEVA